ncbi:hypothetical protein SETIT_9G524100v2 [Setaria italica]|uniref:Uncharacterized protein n=1 Tax=Setaria italica TaxID=4555 RepID=A0A368SV87_SETIT|nr:hypothetical protein SETIT_9G524100v2 [Setaria italica]
MSHRRFLNLVLRCSHGLYSVNHLDTSPLFLRIGRSGSQAEERRQAKRQHGALGEPASPAAGRAQLHLPTTQVEALPPHQGRGRVRALRRGGQDPLRRRGGPRRRARHEVALRAGHAGDERSQGAHARGALRPPHRSPRLRRRLLRRLRL